MRGGAFAGVGALGFVIQLAVVAALIGLARWPAPAATALGVEAAVLHNFAWHRRWTWRDRAGSGITSQLLRFHLANGLTSLAGNVCLSIALTRTGLNPLAANAIAVGAVSVLNYALADRWVFVNGGSAARGRPWGLHVCRTFVRLRCSVPPVNPLSPSPSLSPVSGDQSPAR